MRFAPSCILFVLLALFVGCTKPVEGVCCRSAEDCAATNIPPDRTCPVGFVCGDQHLCIEQTCTLDTQCPSERPVCSAGVCRECDAAHVCKVAEPVCELDTGTCAGCMTNGDCAGRAATAVCNTQSGSCVECVMSTDCPVSKPTCTPSQTCVACVTHADCASNACLPDGTCGSDANTAYVDPIVGTANATCNKATPCKTVASALATTKPNVKLSGTITENVSITRGVSVIADVGTTLRPAAMNTILSITGTGDVLVSDLKIAGARTMMGFGVQVQQDAMSTCTLRRVKVEDCDNVGIRDVFGKQLVVESSIISNNRGGGIASFAPGMTIVNTIVVHNGEGNQFPHFGGIAVEPSASNRIESSTIADNANPTGTYAPGIDCLTTAVVVGRNNIVTGNPISTGCVLDYSLFSPGTTVSGHNKVGVPSFRSTDRTAIDAPTYYRIDALSAARDAGDNSGAPSADIDGDPRPLGGVVDMGADEFKP